MSLIKKYLQEKALKSKMGEAKEKEDDKDEVESSDYKLDKDGKKYRAHKIVFNKGEDDGKNIGEEAEVDEELKGSQHKLDKNKNGKLDKHDFKLLRKEESDEIAEEQIDELNKDTVASYAKKAKTDYSKQSKRMSRAYHQDVNKYDDAAVKRDARKAGLKRAKDRLAEEEMTDAQMKKREEYVKGMKKKYSDFVGKYGKERAKSVMYATATKMAMKENKEEQIDELSRDTLLSYANKVSLDSQKHSKDPTRRSAEKANRSVAGYAKAHNRLEKPVKEEQGVAEGWDDMMKAAKERGSSIASKTSTKTYHDVKKTSTGTVYTKQHDKDGMSKGTGAPSPEQKRGRGRPRKDKFAEAVEFLMDLTEEQFDFVVEEGFDSFLESFLDESGKGYAPGWMIKASPDLKKKIDDIKAKHAAMRKAMGNPAAGKSVDNK